MPGLNKMYRKNLVIGTLIWIALSYGFMQGQPTGMIGALQKNEDAIDLSESQISLIGSFMNIFPSIGMIYLAVLSDKFGRRLCFTISSLPVLLNWIILYFVQSFSALMISRCLAGLGTGQIFVMSTIVTSEYTPYKSRGLFLSLIIMVVPSFGMGLGHALGIILHWRTTALIGIVISTVQVFMPYFWVESPHWLAMKGRFEECEQTFIKLHGTGSSAKHELDLLIKLETRKLKAADESNTTNSFKKLLHAVKQRYFWNIMAMTTIVYVYYTAAGKVAFANLGSVMIEGLTGSSNVLLFTLIVDCFVLVGTCISCFFIKNISIRTLLFWSGFVAIGVLVALSVSLYVKTDKDYFQWVIVILLALYHIIINTGPYPVMDVLLAELFPLDLKLYYFLLATPIIVSTFFLGLLLMPYIVNGVGYHGLFLINSGIMCGCLAFLYLRLPETKRKTLQEIEIFFKTNSFDVDQVLNSTEITKTLI